MKKALLLVLLPLAGCCNVEYFSTTSTTLTPKEPNAPFEFSVDSSLPFPSKMIGRLTLTGGSGLITQMSPEALQKRFIQEAKIRGADGAINISYEQIPVTHVIKTEGETVYEPVTSYENGTYTGSGRMINYSGTSTAMIPVHKPPKTTTFQTTSNIITGLLIVRTQ